MRTKQEYQEALKDIEFALNRADGLSAYWFNHLLTSVSYIQELIDNYKDSK